MISWSMKKVLNVIFFQAYRLEPLILKHYATVRPLTIHKFDAPGKTPYMKMPSTAFAAFQVSQQSTEILYFSICKSLVASCFSKCKLFSKSPDFHFANTTCITLSCLNGSLYM